MPYTSERIRIDNTMLDRRRKLTPEQKEEIKEIYKKGTCGTRPIARQFGVSKATIQIIVNPQIAEKRKQYIKENWKKYQKYGFEHSQVIREHRRYKQRLFKEGKIQLEKVVEE